MCSSEEVIDFGAEMEKGRLHFDDPKDWGMRELD